MFARYRYHDFDEFDERYGEFSGGDIGGIAVSKTVKKIKREIVAKGLDILSITTPDSRQFFLLPDFENCLIEFCRVFNATSKITKLDRDVVPLSLDEFAAAVSCDSSEKIECDPALTRKSQLTKVRRYMADRLERSGEVSLDEVTKYFPDISSDAVRWNFKKSAIRLGRAGLCCSLNDDVLSMS